MSGMKCSGFEGSDPECVLSVGVDDSAQTLRASAESASAVAAGSVDKGDLVSCIEACKARIAAGASLEYVLGLAWNAGFIEGDRDTARSEADSEFDRRVEELNRELENVERARSNSESWEP